MIATLFSLLLSWSILLPLANGLEPVGKRPYEMEWANRTEDTRPPLINFEELADWTTLCHAAAAKFSDSSEQQIWGRRVGKLVYRGEGADPKVTLRPPKPVPLVRPFDSVNLWIYGNNWGWSPDPTTPQTQIHVLLESNDGQQISVVMGRVRWKEWWLMHRRLTPDQLSLLGDSPKFAGIEVTQGTNDQDRVLYFDNLAVYQEPLPPLKFEPRRKRGITLPPGQTVGLNTGPGQLPFPDRDVTILPDNLTRNFNVSLEVSDNAYLFRYRGDDGELIYRYTPATGTLSDVSAQWIGRGKQFRPMDQGGIRFWSNDPTRSGTPDTIQLIRCARQDDSVVAVWSCHHNSRELSRQTEVTYRFHLWQKSLVVDIESHGGQVGEFHIGQVVGASHPRLVTLPFLTGSEQRPAILISGPENRPLFVSAFVDHCRSNASALWFANRVTPAGAETAVAVQNGGSRYLPKTDGERNPCFERLFLTVSPRFEETLPNIPNPPSPWKAVTGERVWRAHGASNREHDYEHWKKVARYGMTKVAITDHETGWRDGGESFTMRTRAAPGKGGDAGQVEYAKKIRALGFRYGIYNNYTDFAPVNEHWDEDYVTRLSDGQWKTAWPRCYNPKPSRAVEVESRLAPIIQNKFHLDTAYCDVHTAVRPWSYCDFDARVPGAGTFAATFYAYGEIMLHQKDTWQGPVYSEGNNHWYYCGLTDGNYGQDQLGQLTTSPWLVDFDLRKIHPLCCNFGMGNPGMFFGRDHHSGKTLADRKARLDRFLAATLAFGHTGFLVFDAGFENTVRSYFSIQQIHARYAQQEVASIQYADSTGKLFDSSAAVASGIFRRSQVATLYADGLQVLVNGHPTETWTAEGTILPPNGWCVSDGVVGELTAFSAQVDGHRVDYVDSPAYIYANGRGHLTRFKKATCDGQMVAHRRDNGQIELIPIGECSVFGVSMGGPTATAVVLNEAGDVIGPAPVRFSRGLVYVSKVPKALSYLLTPAPKPDAPLQCDRAVVVPGETVRIAGAIDSFFHVPATATIGAQLWKQIGQEWIDFSVRPMATVALQTVDPLGLHVVSHLASAGSATIDLGDQTRTVELVPNRALLMRFPGIAKRHECVEAVPMKMTVGDLTLEKTWWIKTEASVRNIATLDREVETGQRIRDCDEMPVAGRTGARVERTSRACGGDKRDCLFMHPPYRDGVGYSYALCKPVDLPKETAAVFRCTVGKADGSNLGDGLLFRIVAIDRKGKQTTVAEQPWGEHAWTSLEADLSAWIGQTVQLKLITDVGPADSSSGDWGCWSNLRIEGREPSLISSIHRQPVTLTRQPGPMPPKDLSLPEIQSARRAVLHFQGIGLQASGRYISHAVLNSQPIGKLPAAGGNEHDGVWSDAQVVLPAMAVQDLQEWNSLTLDNPGRDYFKVGRFWIELELANGQTVSSQITNTAYTQPPEWDFAEGIGVPFGNSIRLKIRIPLR